MSHRLAILAAACVFGAVQVAAQPEGTDDTGSIRERLEAQRDRLQERTRELTEQLERLDNGLPIDVERFRDDRWPRGEHPRPDGPQASEEQRLEMLRDLHREASSDGGPEFSGFLEEDSPGRRALLRRMAARLDRLIDLERRDPELYTMHRNEMLAGIRIARAARLLGELHTDQDTDAGAVEAAESRLASAIAAAFDAKADLALHEVEQTQRRVDQLRQEITETQANRAERIDERFRGMLERIHEHADGRRDRRHGRRGE